MYDTLLDNNSQREWMSKTEKKKINDDDTDACWASKRI